MSSKKPLQGITILDISRLLPGGFASLLLMEQGARVIKVEQPGIGDYYRAVLKGKSLLGGYHVEMINQGKESLGLDLKAPEGREIFLKLLKKADVVIESFRPGALKRLQLDYPRLKKIRPSIILCSITGFSQKGLRKDLAGHDLNFLGLSGLLSRNRDRDDRPVIPDFQVVDLTAGLEASNQILAALYLRKKTGEGCWLDISMQEAGISLARLYAPFPEEHPQRKKSPVGGALIRYGVYETADGRGVTLGALEPKFWGKFCALIGHAKWARTDFEYLGDEAREELKNIFRLKPLSEWVALGEREDVCLFPVEEIHDLKLPPKKKTPQLGEHTDKILRSMGYGSATRQQWRRRGVIQ